MRAAGSSGSTVDAFGEYVEVVARRLGDRVGLWLTQNEPWVVAWLGYGLGVHAPGRTSPADAIAAAHHVLLSHGRAVEVLRRESPGSRVGVDGRSRDGLPGLGRSRRTLPPATSSTASATAGSSIRSAGARIPPTCSSATRRSRRPSRTATSRRSPLPSTSSASTTTSAASSREPPTAAGACAPGRLPPHRHGVGGVAERPLRPDARASATSTTRPRSSSPRTAPPSPMPAATTA